MEVSSKLLEQIAYNTRSRVEVHMLVTMDKSRHEEHLYQPFQTNNKEFKIAVTLLTGIMVYSILQIQIISFISRNQLLMKMVMYKLPYHLVPTKSKV